MENPMSAHGLASALTRRTIPLAALAAMAAFTAFFSATVFAQPAAQPASKPTIVLVHGAFADAASWSGVVARLQAEGYTVLAPANPLRGVAYDSAYIASVVSQINGPVLLAGHSYGGAVISNAATKASNVVGLVYIAAFIPDEDETLMDLSARSTESILGPALRPALFPTGNGAETAPELYVDAAAFPSIFAADLPAGTAAVLAVSQRPIAAIAFGEPSGPVAWKTLPSWTLVAGSDKAIGATLERQMAQRAGSHTVEVDGSHLVMLSQPTAVADLILTAARGAMPAITAGR
jgi:pimeloyl-ACP methyl ester carboxylesterase